VQATPLQVATGYAAFANGGYKIDPYFIDRIEDGTGATVWRATRANLRSLLAAAGPGRAAPAIHSWRRRAEPRRQRRGGAACGRLDAGAAADGKWMIPLRQCRAACAPDHHGGNAWLMVT